MKCKYCKADCVHSGEDIEKECRGHIRMTNADRIRSMSDEELCEMLTIGTGGFDCGTCRDSNSCDRECELHCAEWIKKPVKDGEDE